MESHTEDDNSITTEERDESSSEDEQSSITTENSSEEEIGRCLHEQSGMDERSHPQKDHVDQRRLCEQRYV